MQKRIQIAHGRTKPIQARLPRQLDSRAYPLAQYSQIAIDVIAFRQNFYRLTHTHEHFARGSGPRHEARNLIAQSVGQPIATQALDSLRHLLLREMTFVPACRQQPQHSLEDADLLPQLSGQIRAPLARGTNPVARLLPWRWRGLDRQMRSPVFGETRQRALERDVESL